MRIIPEKLSEEPIKLPANSFWSVFKRFGRDEAIAMVVNVIGTAIATILTSNPLFLSIAGPILEKIGFFPAHFKEAFHIYRTTPVGQRKSLKTYVSKAIKGGSVSLVEDILIHDPVYIGLIYLGISAYPTFPPWILAAISFVVAVVVVAGLEVAYTEARFKLFKHKLYSVGFKPERYFEARFYISAECDPNEIWQRLSSEFGLCGKRELTYHDIYFDTNIIHYSGRMPKIRLRQRTSDSHEGFVQTAQVIFTKAHETSGKVDQCRYFPSSKEKIYLPLEGEMPISVEGIKNDRARNFLSRLVINDGWPAPEITFTRRFAISPKDLLMSVDKLTTARPFYILEIKTYKNITLFLQAMRFVMQEFPVVQTTRGKSEIL